MAANEEEKRRLAEVKASALEREEDRLRANRSELVDPPKPKPGKVELKPQNTEDPHWQKIYKKYKKDILKNEEADDKDVLNKDGCLVFASIEAGEAFFNGLAVPFLCTWKGTDKHMFSCGTGQMYKGSFHEIHKQLENALETEKDPNSIAKLESSLETISRRMALKENASLSMKERLKQTVESGEQKPEQESSTTPNPFETVPKPQRH